MNGYYFSVCRMAEIKAETIPGHTKHARQEIREPFGKEPSGSWNAVLIGGSWHLLDVKWSSE